MIRIPKTDNVVPDLGRDKIGVPAVYHTMVDSEVAIQIVVPNQILQSRQHLILPNLQERLQIGISWSSFAQPENLDEIIQSQLRIGEDLEKRSRVLRNDNHMTSQRVVTYWR